MKPNRIIFLAFALGLIIISCKKGGEETRPATDTTSAIGTQRDTVGYRTEFENFKADVQRQMQEISDTVSVYGSKVKAAAGKRKTEWNKTKADLDKQYSDLQHRLSNYVDKGRDNWEVFKTDFNRSMDTLKMKMKQLY